ncbi:MAG: ABC transporter ATP-binding protein [Planctomycetes bacterium]|nr:ABC transporter ATP-binding protein [Planctomycetota bacterium]
MDAEQADQPRSVLQDLRQLFSFLTPFKAQMLKVLLIIGTINVLAAASLFLVGKGVNEFVGKEAAGAAAAKAVAIIAGLYMLFGVARAVFIRLREPAAMRLAMDLLRSLRTMLYSKVQMLSFTYLDRLTSGQIIERATGDLNMIRNFLTTACFQAFDAVVMAVVAIGFMLWMSWELTLAVLLPYPLICWAYSRWAGRLRILRRRVRDQVDVMMTTLTETIAGVRVIRSFGRHEQEKVRYRGVVDEVFDRVVPAVKIRAFKLVGVYSLARLWVAVLLVVGGYMVIQGRMAVGYLFPFISYMMVLLWRAQALMEMGENAQDARAALERVMALLDAKPDVEDAEGAQDLPSLGRGDIVFENVSFAYHEPPHPADDVVERMDVARRRKGPDTLRNVSLTIRAGERVALVGPTGAGKSTIISLLPRFYDSTSGRVLIDGQDVRHTRLASLRQEIGIVFQETFLFRGTIAENIALGRPEANREDIMRAASLAQADEFIADLPMGYDSEIGERGVSLSGGQRQRLAIARALLKRPRILVLDDAMAAVDARTEVRIRRQLGKLMQNRTTLIIAHRLATVRAADRVVVLREGTIDDVGTHDELAARNDFYRKLCESQLEEDVQSDFDAAGGGA